MRGGSTVVQSPRWRDYVLLRDDRERGREHFRHFWAEHLARAERSVLYILGRGFDPRMCLGLNLLLATGGTGTRDVIALDYRERSTSVSLAHDNLVQKNWLELQSAIQGRGSLTVKPLEFWS